MKIKIRKVEAYNALYTVYVDTDKIIGIEDKDEPAANSTFRVYFENSVWDVHAGDYKMLFANWAIPNVYS